MTEIDNIRNFVALLIAGLLATACGSTPEVDENFGPTVVRSPVVAPATTGSVYVAGTDVRLFEDIRAGRVGDILTVRLAESTNASKNSNTSTSKSTTATLTNPVIFGRPVTADGIPIFEGSLSGDQGFDGEGSSSQSNSLQGDITVTVVERYANGNLLIRGEKWVTLNQGKEFIQLSGIIRPQDIGPDNSILSSRVADAQIAYSSKGVLAAANKMGPFARFFHSILHPY